MAPFDLSEYPDDSPATDGITCATCGHLIDAEPYCPWYSPVNGWVCGCTHPATLAGGSIQ